MKLPNGRWQLGNKHTEQINQDQWCKLPSTCMTYIAYSMWKLHVFVLAKQSVAECGRHGS